MTLLNKQERKVLGILSMGTFLEYFDFYLYVHLAVTLNKVFFEQGDAKSAAMLNAFGYAASYMFRPIGAVVLGHIGDRYGRKTVINITLYLMGIACLGIFFLPSYAEIGLWASVFITFFRILQSVSTMGEIVGGEIYLTEFTKGKSTFLSFSILDMMSTVGYQVALFGITLALAGYFDFRYLFLMGIVIFGLGYHLRRTLVETSEYLNAKKETSIIESIKLIPQIFTNKTYRYEFVIDSMGTISFFIIVVGLGSVLSDKFGYSDAEIATHNMKIGFFNFIYAGLAMIYAVYFNPVTIIKIRNMLSIILIASIPFAMNYSESITVITIIQCMMCLFTDGDIHVGPLVLKNINASVRFRVGALSFALSKAFVAIITTFGMVLVKPYLGNYTYAVFGLPFAIMFFFAVRHFEKLDRANPNGLLQHY